ncbi:MAG: hypothetical protein VX976_02690 [Pseudomonadota bacterium]|nr:hypothetical protein [Pseudomonadota bacterium]
MNEFNKIINWFSKNIFKIITLFISSIILYFLIIMLIPVFQFLGFIVEIINDFQEIFQELEKQIDEFKWKDGEHKNLDDKV